MSIKDMAYLKGYLRAKRGLSWYEYSLNEAQADFDRGYSDAQADLDYEWYEEIEQKTDELMQSVPNKTDKSVTDLI